MQGTCSRGEIRQKTQFSGSLPSWSRGPGPAQENPYPYLGEIWKDIQSLEDLGCAHTVSSMSIAAVPTGRVPEKNSISENCRSHW